MTYTIKTKKLKMRKLSENELGWYEKGYWDASVGNRRTFTKSDLKK